MENNKKCPICGCEEIGEGKLESYMAPTDGSWLSSKVIADILYKMWTYISYESKKSRKV